MLFAKIKNQVLPLRFLSVAGIKGSYINGQFPLSLRQALANRPSYIKLDNVAKNFLLFNPTKAFTKT